MSDIPSKVRATLLPSNFAQLEEHDEQLLRLGMLAERYLVEDPNTSLLKLRQLTELLAQHVAAKVGLYQSVAEPQYELIRRLQDQGILSREIAQLFGAVRRAGNAASHAMTGDHAGALAVLKVSWQLGVWFHRTFKNPDFEPDPFIPPQPASGGQLLLEQMAAEAEGAKAAAEQRLTAEQAQTAIQPKKTVTALVAAANKAAGAVHLDEAETRKLIDQQLNQAGWIADSATLTYSAGARPEKGKNMAIAEWPTANGPADYMLFSGLTPLAAVEAKRKNTDVSGALQQAKRYSRGFGFSGTLASPGGPWGEHRVPYVFSSNGRPFLRQIATRSGIWFCDVRHPDNLGHALDGWYTPEGLTGLLKRDEQRAHEKLANEPFAYGFALRHYQQAAIAKGQREMLLAMATGTGKTKTCIALIYRLLKAQRFRRILFLVDRSALGEQAANAFQAFEVEVSDCLGMIRGSQIEGIGHGQS